MAKQDIAIIANNGFNLDEYVSHGFKPEEVEGLEAIASQVRDLNKTAANAIIETGARLSQVKETTAHGDWQYFVEYRCRLSMISSQRYMAAYAVTKENPMLADVVESVALGALYRLGASKNTTPAVIEKVVALTEDGEVTVEEVEVLLKEAAPEAAPRKEGKLGFELMSKAKGSAARDQIVGISDTAWGTVARAGLNTAILEKNRAFKNFCQEVAKGGSSNDTARALHGMLIAGFVTDYSAEHGEDK